MEETRRGIDKMRADTIRAIAENNRRIAAKPADTSNPRGVFVAAYASKYPKEPAPTAAEVDAVIRANPGAGKVMDLVEFIRTARRAGVAPP